MAGTIDEVKALAEKLEKVDGSQAARRLSVKMNNAVPMFEATEEVRLLQFQRPGCTDTLDRSAVDVSTGNSAVLPSHVQSLALASTKAVLAASVRATISKKMMKMATMIPMQPQPAVRHVTNLPGARLSKPDLPTQPVAARSSNLGLGSTAKAY